MIEIVIPNAPIEEYIEKKYCNTVNSLVVTPKNIAHIEECLPIYKGYTFIINAMDIHCRKWFTPMNRIVGNLVKIWRHLGLSIIIVCPERCQSLYDGMAIVDKYGIRPYITSAYYASDRKG